MEDFDFDSSSDLLDEEYAPDFGDVMQEGTEGAQLCLLLASLAALSVSICSRLNVYLPTCACRL